MRVKTIEKVFPLNEIFNSVKALVDQKYAVNDDTSFLEQDRRLVVIGIDVKDITIVMRASLDPSMNRTYISLVVIQTKDLADRIQADLKDEDSIIKAVGKFLIGMIKSGGEGGGSLFNPLMSLAIKGLKAAAKKYGLYKRETTLFTDILSTLYQKFQYDDVLIPYPFRIPEMEGELGIWEEAYGSYLRTLEDRLKDNRDRDIISYRYYDFSESDEEVQRIFDLVIREKEVKSFIPMTQSTGFIPRSVAEKIQRKKAKKRKYGTTFLWLTFVYCNKTTKPINLIDVNSLISQVGDFCKTYQQNNKETYIEIKPRVILISIHGYDSNVEKYLRTNQYGDDIGVSPTFIIPPINGTWHNFREFHALSKKEEKRFKEVYRTVKIDRNTWAGYYKSHKEDFDLLSKKKEQFEEYNEINSRWKSLLSIQLAADLLDINRSKELVQDFLLEYNYEGNIKPLLTSSSEIRQEEVSGDTKFCMHCGKQIPAIAKFCQFCGGQI